MLQPGQGQLDLGLVLSPRIAGGGIRLDHRLTPWLTAFILGEAGYSPALGRFDYLGIAGARFNWGPR